MLIAAGVVAYGIVEDHTASAIGGGLAGLTSAALLILAKVRLWTTDTSAEREALAAARREAADERNRYLAAQGAQMAEHDRRMRDLEAERAALHAQLQAKRVRLHQEIDDELASIKIEAYLVGVDHGRRGIHDASFDQPQPEGQVVQFPGPAGPARERTIHPADAAREAPAARDREVGRP
jgi:F0F1-type ATP synthase epsilon subunit